MTKVLVLRGGSYKAVGAMFEARGYDVTYDVISLPTVDLVVFTGGSDVSPYIYGEEPEGARGCDPQRDEIEVSIWQSAKVQDIPCVGICRGGQLLNVLNGGKMIQHLGQTISGDVEMDTPTGSIEVRADHHQGMVGVDGNEISWMWLPVNQEMPDYEVYYPATEDLCVQYHPEWDHKGTEKRFFELLEEYIDV